MTAISIKDINLFRITEEEYHITLYGGNQEWYVKRWQRMAGCGPSTAANIMYYLNKTRYNTNIEQTKEEFLRLMNEIWRYVTPGMGGVSSTTMLMEGFRKYLTDQKLEHVLDSIDIGKKPEQRPDISEVISFLEKALKEDVPAAFLNLEHGSILELESWHWVTVVALEYDLEDRTAFITILDNGMRKRIDLVRWLNSTKLGGGFVSLRV